MIVTAVPLQHTKRLTVTRVVLWDQAGGTDHLQPLFPTRVQTGYSPPLLLTSRAYPRRRSMVLLTRAAHQESKQLIGGSCLLGQ